MITIIDLLPRHLGGKLHHRLQDRLFRAADIGGEDAVLLRFCQFIRIIEQGADCGVAEHQRLVLTAVNGGIGNGLLHRVESMPGLRML